MKKTIRGYVVLLLGAVLVFAFLGFAVVIAFNEGSFDVASGEALSAFRAILLNGAIGAFAGSLGGVLLYWVNVGEQGVSNGFWKKLAWREIERVEIVGVPNRPITNKITFVGGDRDVSIAMFVYADQEELLAVVKRFLPWATALSATSVPCSAAL